MKRIRKLIVPMLAALVLTVCAAPGAEKGKGTTKELAYVAELDLGFDQAIERVTEALKAEGFGIISRIDLHTTFKKKLDVEMDPHTILGACNPKLAHRAVTALPEASLMLPCNVTVQAVGAGRTVVRIVNPHTIMADAGLDEHPAVNEVGVEADERLKRVAEKLRGNEGMS